MGSSPSLTSTISELQFLPGRVIRRSITASCGRPIFSITGFATKRTLTKNPRMSSIIRFGPDWSSRSRIGPIGGDRNRDGPKKSGGRMVARWPLDTGARHGAMNFRCSECGVRIQRAGALRSPAYRGCWSKGTAVARWPLDTGARHRAMNFPCDECGVRIQRAGALRSPAYRGCWSKGTSGSPVASGHRGTARVR